MRNRFLLTLLGGLVSGLVAAQSRGVFVPLNADYYHLIERYEIRSGRLAPGFHASLKPYHRRDVVALAESLLQNPPAPGPLSRADRFNLEYLRNDSWEWASDSTVADSPKPLFNFFYRKKTDLYQARTPEFDIHVNPVFYGSTGLGSDVPSKAFINTRGIEIRGSIGRKLGFYTFLTENQLRLPGYYTARVQASGALPGEGFVKSFKNQADAFDFFSSRAYITFDPLRAINLQFGYDKVFVGSGVRSVILSDFSAPMLFLKITTRLGRFQYQNLFAEIINNQLALPYGTLPPKKFLAFHRLSVNIGRNFNIGFFESIVHSRDKSQGYFDLNYLNPVIFYRAIEGQKNSPDNALLGLDFRGNFLRHFSLYGQLNLDELKVSEIRAGKGWWGNKFAAQLGLKYVEAFGLRNLDLQAEVNLARPYTYQHLSSLTNYVHYNQPLAHPLGANFREFVGVIRYQPLPRLSLTVTGVAARYGADATATQNWGGNPLLSYNTRQQDYNNQIGQGLSTNLLLLDAVASYQLRHNVFLDFRQIVRRQDAEGLTNDRNTAFSSVALRLNIAQRNLAF